jgi:hypothetical protein
MSRSAWWAWGAGCVLVIAAAAVAGREWAILQTHRTWWIALIIAGTIYAAATSAVLIRRIAEPTLDMPWLAIIGVVLLFILWVVAAIWGDVGAGGTSRYRSHAGSSKTKGLGLGWAITGSLIALAFYGGGIAAMILIAQDIRRTPVTDEMSEPEPTKPRPLAPTPTLAAELAGLHFTDARDKPSPEANKLARWLDAHGKWSELAVATNETSLALVEKDPMHEAGKRLCATGTLARIEKIEVDGTSVFSASLTTKDGDALEVYAVGSSGDLVKRSPARFCGVITGRLHDASFAVGKFELPAEK